MVNHRNILVPKFDFDVKRRCARRAVYSDKNTIAANVCTPLRPNSDLSQTSHCNIKGLSFSEVTRIENTDTQVEFY